MRPQYKIAYIVSMTHSGSSLLDSLIGAHSQAIGIGEIFQLKSYANAERIKSKKTMLGNQCTCGANTIWDCLFWIKVNKIIKECAARSLRDLNINSSDSERFALDNKILFDAVASVSGAKVIVDSSKSVNRFWKLKDSGIFEITPIFLLRDPRGQVYSIMKRTGGRELLPAMRYSKGTIRNTVKLWNQNPIIVSYAKLSTEPEETVATVMHQLGLNWEPGQLDWSNVVRHNLGGNAMRARSDSQIRHDESWRNALSYRQRFVIYLVVAPALYLAMHRWKFERLQ